MHGLAGVTDPAVAQRWLETAQAAGAAEAEFEALPPTRSSASSLHRAQEELNRAVVEPSGIEPLTS